jgi:hypothetical protein
MYDIIKTETVEPYVDNLKLTVQHVRIAVWNKRGHEMWHVNRIIYPIRKAWKKENILSVYFLITLVQIWSTITFLLDK